MSLFVTGTGTEIGKTYVCCGLLRAARAAGVALRALKPVVSGFEGAGTGSDPALLLAAEGRQPTLPAIAAIAPFRFTAPLSPDMAARAEGRALDYAALLAFCRTEMDRAGQVLIEGVGGVMVPLDDCHTVLDWLAELGLPALLVAGSYLGALSHALTALAVLQAREVPIAGVVVNETPSSSVGLLATAEVIGRHAGAPVWCLQAGGEGAEHTFSELSAQLCHPAASPQGGLCYGRSSRISPSSWSRSA